MDQYEASRVTYYVSTLWALVGNDFVFQWKQLRRWSTDLITHQSSSDRREHLRNVFGTLDHCVERVENTCRAHGVTNEAEAGVLLLLLEDITSPLEEFWQTVEQQLRAPPSSSADQQEDELGPAVEQVRSKVCEFADVWVRPVFESGLLDVLHELQQRAGLPVAEEVHAVREEPLLEVKKHAQHRGTVSVYQHQQIATRNARNWAMKHRGDAITYRFFFDHDRENCFLLLGGGHDPELQRRCEDHGVIEVARTGRYGRLNIFGCRKDRREVLETLLITVTRKRDFRWFDDAYKPSDRHRS